MKSILKTILKTIRNIINPKIKKPENCICPENEYRYWCTEFVLNCPVHKHHIKADLPKGF